MIHLTRAVRAGTAVEEIIVPGDLPIRSLQTIGDREIRGLSEVLIDCVESGASVGFMHPMSRAKAEGYWQSTSASVARGARVVLAAQDTAGRIVGTVQIILNQPENQPHRGDLAKMLVHRRVRRQGVGAALLSRFGNTGCGSQYLKTWATILPMLIWCCALTFDPNVTWNTLTTAHACLYIWFPAAGGGSRPLMDS